MLGKHSTELHLSPGHAAELGPQLQSGGSHVFDVSNSAAETKNMVSVMVIFRGGTQQTWLSSSFRVDTMYRGISRLGHFAQGFSFQ